MIEYAVSLLVGIIFGYAWCYAATRRITRNHKAALQYFREMNRSRSKPQAETNFNSSLDFPDESPVFYEPINEIDRNKI